MILFSKVSKKKADELINAWKETKELNELMKSYMKVSLENQTVDRLEITKEIREIRNTQREIQDCLDKIYNFIEPLYFEMESKKDNVEFSEEVKKLIDELHDPDKETLNQTPLLWTETEK
ncbi:hypothetical protein P8815_18240 [Bacillus altitudinis]|uniref:hypothetical protein n=1 Tax=Bacillus TaxID=1386 RepID=UPI000260A9A9|nr:MULTISPECIES: hypothetical protein [Bacillus]EIL83350.1 hypothetical protein BAME_34140 [Bacillus sp. M 2-6]MEC0473681.1 hypothetical protein [Bacillus altitudinis]